MAQSDIRTFITEALLRFDPGADVSEGSALQAEVIDPLMARIGTDPFDEDIHVFIRSVVRQSNPDLAITEVDELTDLLIDPMRVIIEPLVREIKLVKLRSSIQNLESLNDDEVDALFANFFEARQAGSYATGVVRAYFASPQTVSISVVNAAFSNGLRFRPTRPQQITADQMTLNISGSEYYFDINYTAELRGDEYNVEAGTITSISGLSGASRVTNPRRFRNGTARETSVEFAGRTQRNASGDRTLVVERGIQSVLKDAFPGIRRLFSIGYRDAEMQRDVIRGGSLGPIPEVDGSGEFFGTGAVIDDFDADTISYVVEASTGSFLSRLGAVGTEPEGWYVTLAYTDTSGSSPVPVMVDAVIEEVLSDTTIRVDTALPLLGSPPVVFWGLRRRVLTISEIPGGIVLPDTAAGELEITTDTVHIGGKVDVYVAGESESATALITNLSDEDPLAYGGDAVTDATDVVVLNDIAAELIDSVEAGMSLVLDEGADTGAYRILAVYPLVSPFEVRISTVLTGTQTNLSWRITDRIDVNLSDPKAIKLIGSDLVTAAGSNSVTTVSSSNFIDANVQINDIIEINDARGGGDFTVTAVSALALAVDPPTPRTLLATSYRVFTRSAAVESPVLRVKSVEIVDSSGAPTGTKIPYRDAVAALSRGVQNQGSGQVFDDLVDVGIVTVGITVGLPIAVGGTVTWALLDPDAVWAGVEASGTVTIPATTYEATDLAVVFNADSGFLANGITAVVQSSGYSDPYVGFVSRRLLVITGGSAIAALGLTTGVSNAHIAVDSPGVITAGDVVEFLAGNNVGTSTRVRRSSTVGTAYTTDVGLGALEIRSSSVSTLPINNGDGLSLRTVLRPERYVRARIGRPSVGIARTYFLAPTSAQFTSTAEFSATNNGVQVQYRTDPDVMRQLVPALPRTELPQAGVVTTNTLTDSTVDFLLLGVRSGDVLDVKYTPITGSSPMVEPVAVAGLTLEIIFGRGNSASDSGSSGTVLVTFPNAMTRDEVVDYINEQVGREIATLSSNALRILGVDDIFIGYASTALSPLFLSPGETRHPLAGSYVVAGAAATTLALSAGTPLVTGSPLANTSYTIRRQMQRISSTEMNDNLDASGLYYVDAEIQSVSPGDQSNLPVEVALSVSGYDSDGYRLSTAAETTSYSRAEVLSAEFSTSIVLVGSPDSPEEALELGQQSIEVTYDRSQLVDEVQSFVDSKFQRVLCSEPLVRHLLPHYVSLNWNYSGGASEADSQRVIEDALEVVEADTELEVNELTAKLRSRGATSIYTPDTSTAALRTAPLLLVVNHNTDRTISAQVVRDVVVTGRMARYIPDRVVTRRTTTGGIR